MCSRPGLYTAWRSFEPPNLQEHASHCELQSRTLSTSCPRHPAVVAAGFVWGWSTKGSLGFQCLEPGSHHHRLQISKLVWPASLPRTRARSWACCWRSWNCCLNCRWNPLTRIPPQGFSSAPSSTTLEGLERLGFAPLDLALALPFASGQTWQPSAFLCPVPDPDHNRRPWRCRLALQVSAVVKKRSAVES